MTPARVAAGAVPAGEVLRGTARDAGTGEAPAPAARATRTSLRLPFWVRSSLHEEAADGRRLTGSIRDTLQVPWTFLLAVGLYGLLGIRRSGPAPASGEATPVTGRTGPGRGPGGAGALGGGTLGRGILALLALGAVLAAVPAPRHASAAGCGGIDGPLCYIYEKCERKLIIIRKCTTEYAYYPDFV